MRERKPYLGFDILSTVHDNSSTRSGFSLRSQLNSLTINTNNQQAVPNPEALFGANQKLPSPISSQYEEFQLPPQDFHIPSIHDATVNPYRSQHSPNPGNDGIFPQNVLDSNVDLQSALAVNSESEVVNVSYDRNTIFSVNNVEASYAIEEHSHYVARSDGVNVGSLLEEDAASNSAKTNAASNNHVTDPTVTLPASLSHSEPVPQPCTSPSGVGPISTKPRLTVSKISHLILDTGQ